MVVLEGLQQQCLILNSVLLYSLGMNIAIDRAISAMAGQSRLASAIGVTPPAIAEWRKGDRPVPSERCVQIERATNGAATCEELRPDVRWHRIPDPDWPHADGRPLIDVAPTAAPATGQLERAA